MLTFRFTGVKGEMVEKEMLVSGMVGKQVRFEFSPEWDGLRKAAVYRAGEICRTNIDIQELDTIPDRVLSKSLRRLYVGVYGISEDGQVAIPTRFVPGPFIHIGAAADEDSGFDREDPFWVEMEQALEETVRFTPQTLTEEQKAQARENIGVSGGGLMNVSAASLLLTILRKAVYTEDVSGTILDLETAINTSQEEETVYYSVSCSLEHVAAQPASATVTQGQGCTVVLTAAEGYVLDSVTVTMGGSDITGSVYAGGVVTIASVTGNVVITAKAVSQAVEESGGIMYVSASVFDNVLNNYADPSIRMSAVTTDVVADTPFPQLGTVYAGDLYLLPVPAGTSVLNVTSPGIIGGPQFFTLSNGVYTCVLDAGWQTVDGFSYTFAADTYDFVAINFKNETNTAFFTEDYDTSGIAIEFAAADSGGDGGEEDGGTEVTEVPITLSLTKTRVTNNQRTIVIGEMYMTTFVPEDGYFLDSVKVTMGGTDVTAEAYSNGSISIPAVTGAILIMAVAAAEPGPVTISEIIKGTTSFDESAGLLIHRGPAQVMRATLMPAGQYLRKGSTYRFGLGNASEGYSFGIQIFAASSAGLVFNSADGQETYFNTVTSREVDTGWMQEDYTYTPTENNRIFTMNFKHEDGTMDETYYAELLANVVIEEVTA